MLQQQLKLFCLVLCIFAFSSNLHARTWPTKMYENDPNANENYRYPETFPELVSYQDPDFDAALELENPLEDEKFRSYNVIVVVNKEARENGFPGQTVRVYDRETNGLRYAWFTSSARTGKVTPNGFFRPQFFSSEHQSSLYANAPMSWAVFFNAHIASHATGAVLSLGKRASAGCLRLEKFRAESLFHLVGNSGYGYVDRIHRESGKLMYVRGTNKVQQVRSYKTLYIVQD